VPDSPSARAFLRISFVLMILAAIVPTAHADLFANGGFETPVLTPGTISLFSGGANIGGWTVVGAQVAIVQTTYGEPGNGITAFSSQEGLNSLDLTGAGNQGPTSGVQQDILTTIGQVYDLSFYVGRAASTSPFYSSPATVDLSINGGARVGYTNTALTSGTNNWMQFTTSFVATSSTTKLTFLNGTPSPTAETGLDNVVLVPRAAAVPEPSSAFLLISGGGIIFIARRLSYKRRIS
jgi:hypothetical protein